MDASRTIGRDASRIQYIRMNRSVRDAVRLLSRSDVDALVVIDGRCDDDGAIIGIVTERDVFRAMAAGGLDVLDGLVWMLVKNHFVSVDVTLSPADRLEQFCVHKTDHIAIMDGFALRSVESIWDCVAHGSAGTVSSRSLGDHEDRRPLSTRTCLPASGSGASQPIDLARFHARLRPPPDGIRAV